MGPFVLAVTFRGMIDSRSYAGARVAELVPPIGDVDIRMLPRAYIEGVLVDDEGRPLEALWVRATDSHGRCESARVDERGRFRVGVVEGRRAKLALKPSRPNEKIPWRSELGSFDAGTVGVVLRASRLP